MRFQELLTSSQKTTGALRRGLPGLPQPKEQKRIWWWPFRRDVSWEEETVPRQKGRVKHTGQKGNSRQEL